MFVTSTSKKGTTRSGQEYEAPLLVLNGTEYAAMPFQVLHDMLCTALRGAGPRLVAEVFRSDSVATLVFEDNSVVEAVDGKARPLSAEEEAGIAAALKSYRQGRVVDAKRARQIIDAALGR